MRRITGKAKDETLIELQSAADSQSTGKQKGVRGVGHLCPATLERLVFLEGLSGLPASQQGCGAFRATQ